MRISDWSSDVCSSDLLVVLALHHQPRHGRQLDAVEVPAPCRRRDADQQVGLERRGRAQRHIGAEAEAGQPQRVAGPLFAYPGGHRVQVVDLAAAFVERALRVAGAAEVERSEEHTSELQSLMRISYAGLCLKK